MTPTRGTTLSSLGLQLPPPANKEEQVLQLWRSVAAAHTPRTGSISHCFETRLRGPQALLQRGWQKQY